MKKRTVKYTNDKGEIIGALRRVKDELPEPDDLPSLDELAGKTGSQTKVKRVRGDKLGMTKSE